MSISSDLVTIIDKALSIVKLPSSRRFESWASLIWTVDHSTLYNATAHLHFKSLIHINYISKQQYQKLSVASKFGFWTWCILAYIKRTDYVGEKSFKAWCREMKQMGKTCIDSRKHCKQKSFYKQMRYLPVITKEWYFLSNISQLVRFRFLLAHCTTLQSSDDVMK